MKTNKSRNTDGLPPVYLMAGAVTAILVCALLSIGLEAKDRGEDWGSKSRGLPKLQCALMDAAGCCGTPLDSTRSAAFVIVSGRR